MYTQDKARTNSLLEICLEIQQIAIYCLLLYTEWYLLGIHIVCKSEAYSLIRIYIWNSFLTYCRVGSAFCNAVPEDDLPGTRFLKEEG